jgi:hypothetical protein
MTVVQEMKGDLPSAPFTCGTEDPMLEDSGVVTTKWLMAGSQAALRMCPGAPYGFIWFHEKLPKRAGDGLPDLEQHLLKRL